jgi:uncharacterized membrane protein
MTGWLDPYFAWKTLHVISSTILFGLGMGTAFFMFRAHLIGDVQGIAIVARIVCLADYAFTLSSGIFQPISGYILIRRLGLTGMEGWLMATYVLYATALACWLPVVWLQLRMRDLAVAAAGAGEPLPPLYHRYFWMWFSLGWPAFLGLVAVFYLMVAKPF